MKRIVICCDGTNNQLEADQTNVFRLFSSLVDDPTNQIMYYDPGVGTLAQPGIQSQIGKRLSLIYGLAFGVGFTRNLEESYSFLMQNYVSGDRLFMFGFSRGAYTVRALAGMIHMFGLLDPDQENLLPYLSRAYTAANFDVADKVREVSRKDVRIDFLGLWDTVTSLGFVYKRKALPYTTNNSSVRVVRHAMAIDERRSYFRQNRWGTVFVGDPRVNQNVKEVWFAGVHSDVGGGYPEGAPDPVAGSGNDRSALSKITLQWIVEEAKGFGMLVKDLKYQQALQGKFAAPFQPNPLAVVNKSLHGPWWVAEFLPMNYTVRHNAFYLPLGRRRKIPPGAIVHESVILRKGAGIGYEPSNLPTNLGPAEPWSAAVTLVNKQASTVSGSKLARVIAPVLGFLGALLVLYLLVVAMFLALRLLGKICFHPAIWQTPASAFLWITWLIHSDNIKYFLPIAIPLAVLMVGGLILGKVSGLSVCELRVKNGKILHRRFGGYTKAVAEEQLHQLREDGRRAYRKMLKLDLAFPLFYGVALIWGLRTARPLARFHSPNYAEFLPLLTVLSDWVENLTLLGQLPKYHDIPPGGLSLRAIRIASFGTMVKLVTFTAILLWIIWLLACGLLRDVS